VSITNLLTQYPGQFYEKKMYQPQISVTKLSSSKPQSVNHKIRNYYSKRTFFAPTHISLVASTSNICSFNSIVQEHTKKPNLIFCCFFFSSARTHSLARMQQCSLLCFCIIMHYSSRSSNNNNEVVMFVEKLQESVVLERK
jgi:hypothetical protein